MKGLTAKVFRTYNASITFQDQLDNNTPDTANIQELHNAYNKANRMVAILCNHQRTVPKGHAGSMEKMNDKVGVYYIITVCIILYLSFFLSDSRVEVSTDESTS